MTLTHLLPIRVRLGERCHDLAQRLHQVDQKIELAAEEASEFVAATAAQAWNCAALDHQAAALRAELGQVRRAIERFDAGRYGCCEYCGAAIDEARLQALPETTRCARCINPRAVRPQPERVSA